MLLLLEHIERLWEYGTDGAPAHLQLEVFSIRLIARPVPELAISFVW